jgi:hypothetical protein
VDRGYPKDCAIRFVSNHHCLPNEHRFVLVRAIVESGLALSRRAKSLSIESMRGGVVFIDGYNVLITVESLLAGYPIYLCDDRVLRDTRGLFRSYKSSQFTIPAISMILDLLALVKPSWIMVLLDQQMSHSGELAELMRVMIARRFLPGNAMTARDVDHLLKEAPAIIATSDGNIIDSVSSFVDIPRNMARKMGIDLQLL